MTNQVHEESTNIMLFHYLNNYSGRAEIQKPVEWSSNPVPVNSIFALTYAVYIANNYDMIWTSKSLIYLTLYLTMNWFCTKDSFLWCQNASTESISLKWKSSPFQLGAREPRGIVGQQCALEKQIIQLQYFIILLNLF